MADVETSEQHHRHHRSDDREFHYGGSALVCTERAERREKRARAHQFVNLKADI
jgi:hypothetical protein